uniref:uncharacterized protein LOC120343149 n=1 Tax=Styela clava TaxID=7725 RepID=UPI001939E53E|nr:uncharacterized protein LOC120343149 [Styela clava]
MKVIVAGFIKTGTKTMAAVLDILGYSVYDLEHHFYYLEKDWQKILKEGGTKEDFHRMYKDVDVGVDVPFVIFWEEILEAFPDAKIIFLQRTSEDVWQKSVENQVKMFNKNWLFRSLSVLSYTGYKFFAHVGLVNRIMFGNHTFFPWNVFNGISSTVTKKRYRDHCSSVLERAPKDRLLICDLREGWEPLCEFLGKDVPDTPFPHENERGKLAETWMKRSPIFKRMQNEMMISLSVIGLILCYLVYLLFVGLF